MRSRLFVSTLLLVVIGCGRYDRGHSHDDDTSSGGTGNVPAGGSNAATAGAATSAGGNEAGAAGSELGGSEAGAADSEAGSAGLGGSGSEPTVTRARWLASETFLSSASPQTVLSLIDLARPEADPVLLDSQSSLAEGFSADGRWLLYELLRDGKQVDLYLVNLADEKPSTPQFVLRTRTLSLPRGTWTMPCQWAPDSSRLACLKDIGTAAAPASSIVAFDTSQALLGPELSVGPGERDLAFLDRDTLVYGYGADDFARVAWVGGTLGTPVPLGVGGGAILQQSPDGARALVNRNPLNSPQALALLDFRLGQAQTFALPAQLPGTPFSFSISFDAAFSVEPAAAGDTGLGFYNYYAVNGIQVTQVGHRPIDAALVFGYYRSAGPRLVRSNGDTVVMDTIANGTVTEQVVPGEYNSGARKVIRFEIDPAGAWIYFSTAQLDAQSHAVEATAQHWLSRVQASGSEPAQLIGQGYLNDSTSVVFSPNSQRLVLHGENGYPHQDTPATFRWFDLSDPSQIKSYGIDPHSSWGKVTWSADSSYVSIIAGDVVSKSRLLMVVDTLAPNEKPRPIVSCSSNPAPLPGCPGVAMFQP